MEWKPILEASEVQAVVEGLSPILCAPCASPTLASGAAGLAIACEHIGRVSGIEPLSAAVEVHLETCLSHTMEGLSLYSGACGIAWLLEELSEKGWDIDVSAAEELDTAVTRYLTVLPATPAQYDLMQGLAGLGLYVARRTRRVDLRATADLLIDRLINDGERDRWGLRWLQRSEWIGQTTAYPAGRYNLGVAHGVPGVVSMLAEMYSKWPSPALHSAVEEVMLWLLAQARTGDVVSRYSFSSGGPGAIALGRLGWCYGDLSVAVTCLRCARYAHVDDWESVGVELAMLATRREVTGAGVDTPGLCHGAAGVGHLFNRMYQATGDLAFRDAARKWLLIAREMVTKASAPDIERGFLGGLAGVLLALVSSAQSEEPSWDHLLLAHIPSSRAG